MEDPLKKEKEAYKDFIEQLAILYRTNPVEASATVEDLLLIAKGRLPLSDMPVEKIVILRDMLTGFEYEELKKILTSGAYGLLPQVKP